MATYTIEVYSLLQDKNFNLFNFDYDFYTDSEVIRKEFEKKFLDRYMFHEIGFETVTRFRHYLRERLNSIAPYYKQLYITELESKDINFLLNKDLTETFERDVENNGLNSTDMTSSDSTTQNNKESYLENGNADLSLDKGNLTGMSEVKGENDSRANSSTNVNTNSSEKTTLISQGNIGITSSAELLRDWRSVLINIQDMIISDCADLFMGVY